MADFHIAIPSAGRLLRVFARLKQLTNRGLYEQVGAEIVKRTRARFKAKRSPEGQTWKAWSTPYAATRGAGDSLLVDEGELERSIESKIAGDRLLIYSTADYAGPVQKTRPFFGISSDDERQIMDLIEDQFRSAVNGV